MKKPDIVETQKFMMPRGERFPSGTAVVSELKALTAKAGGLLQPEQVVEAARDPSSPLHAKFIWEDSLAAERYRLIQARFLISVSVQYIKTDTKMISTKVFVSLSTDRNKKGDRGGYRTLVDVMADDDKKNQLLMDALSQMSHFQEKYKSLEELRDVMSAIGKTQEKLKKE